MQEDQGATVQQVDWNMKQFEPVGGYAPGYYLGSCRECNRRYCGAKRSWQCHACAVRLAAQVEPAAVSVHRFDGAALGDRIRQLRAARNMSLQEVGEAAGLTKSHVWELEQGRSRNPTVNAVWGLSAALSVSPAMLLGLNDQMPPLSDFALKIAGMVNREIRRVGSADAQPLPGV